VLGRLLSLRSGGDDTFDDEGLVRTLSGLLSGLIIPTIGSFVRIVARLVDLPPERRRPFEDAVMKRDDPVIRQYVLEAERLDPNPAVLYRYCERECVVAEGTKRATRIPAGTKVLVWLSSAARDPEVIAQPEEFRPRRPEWQYPQFGFGQHRCLGDEISQVVHREMLAALFSMRGLRRDPSEKPVYGPPLRGGYPKHFRLQFDR
jgi:cytochrome P450